MVDQTLSDGGPAASICPWCSASYTGAPENCPSCGATLNGEGSNDAALPGLTAIDAAAIVRAKTPAPRQRSRLLSWLSGDYEEGAVSQADAEALAPPDAAVRREILRLELEAEVANLQAEADAMKAEAVMEGLAPDASPEDAAAARELVADIEAVSAGLDEVDDALDADPLGASVATATADSTTADAAAEPTAEDAQPG
jgi:hypothetical protein